jgi:uncharacterized cupin superfamily protein
MTDRADELRNKLIRNFNSTPLNREERAPHYDTLCARLATGTAAKQLGVSIDVLAPGMRGCPYHLHHAQEEAFVILEGEGTLRVAGELLAVKAGDVLFLPAGPEYPHQLINTSGAPMKYLSISTKQQPEICEYPDSDKYLVTAPGFDVLQRHADALDYWDGEP